MDRSDVLAALVSAQRDLALHLDTARTELISLPHQLADLQPMKTPRVGTAALVECIKFLILVTFFYFRMR